jgi:hypothetical protein
MDTIGTTGITNATDSGTPFGSTGTGSNVGTSSGVCASCGQPIGGSRGLEQFLGKLGISDEMIGNMKSSVQNIDMEEYLNTVRDYFKSGTTKATNFAKENPGKVAAGAAVLAIGTGLLIAALNRE